MPVDKKLNGGTLLLTKDSSSVGRISLRLCHGMRMWRAGVSTFMMAAGGEGWRDG